MKRYKKEKAPRNPRITIELTPELLQALRRVATVETRGNLSELIRQRITAAVAERPEVTVRDLVPTLALITAVLDELRLARTFNDGHIENARALYELILERCYPIAGVEER